MGHHSSTCRPALVHGAPSGSTTGVRHSDVRFKVFSRKPGRGRVAKRAFGVSVRNALKDSNLKFGSVTKLDTIAKLRAYAIRYPGAACQAAGGWGFRLMVRRPQPAFATTGIAAGIVIAGQLLAIRQQPKWPRGDRGGGGREAARHEPKGLGGGPGAGLGEERQEHRDRQQPQHTTNDKEHIIGCERLHAGEGVPRPILEPLRDDRLQTAEQPRR